MKTTIAVTMVLEVEGDHSYDELREAVDVALNYAHSKGVSFGQLGTETIDDVTIAAYRINPPEQQRALLTVLELAEDAAVSEDEYAAIALVREGMRS